MLAHIHPSLAWFACEHRPMFNGIVHPGPVSRTTQGPPRAQSPFAPSRCYLSKSSICCYLNRHYPVLIARTDSCASPKPSHRFRLSLIRQVFAGCHQSLLGVGPSRRYLRSPCIGAWTPTPQRPFGAHARFFPKGDGLTSSRKGLAR